MALPAEVAAATSDEVGAAKVGYFIGNFGESARARICESRLFDCFQR